jgi:membrane protease YdiL (CAAX protease family)
MRLARPPWIGAVVAGLVAALLHLPNWGVGPVLAFVVSEAIGVGFFLWRRDLLANIVAHILVDGTAFIVAPMLS